METLIITEAIYQVAMTVVCASASALVGWLLAMAKKQRAEEKAISQIIRALARREIMDAYQAHVVEGRKLSVERCEQLVEIYDAYRALSGNGTVERMFKEIMAKRPWVVTD